MWDAMDADALAASFNLIKNVVMPTAVYVITDNGTLANRIVDNTTQPVIISTASSAPWVSDIESNRVTVRRNGYALPEINMSNYVESMISSACMEGLINSNDKAICVAENGKLGTIMIFEGKNMPAVKLRDEINNGVKMNLVDNVMKIAFEIAREGREGSHAGALFVIGDTNNVMENSHQLIINPFEGHSRRARDICADCNLATIKDLAQLDGAMLIDEVGLVISAGRHLDTVKDVDFPMGLGARNLAAASITKLTKSVAILVSSTGIVRIYHGGSIVFEAKAV